MTHLSDRTRTALKSVHRVKTGAYGNAWKKRGEVLSILCNVARKVDRLEIIATGGKPSADETLIDTCVDLLIYCLKYQTFLIDVDPSSASASMGRLSPSPLSDSLEGFTWVLERIDLSPLDKLEGATQTAFVAVPDAFVRLEQCFVGINATTSASDRLQLVRDLTRTAVDALSAAVKDNPSAFANFLVENPE